MKQIINPNRIKQGTIVGLGNSKKVKGRVFKVNKYSIEVEIIESDDDVKNLIGRCYELNINDFIELKA